MPMPWPSLDTASRVADTANLFFIASLVVGVVSTITIVWMANVKEAHWDIARIQSEERIAEAQRETARLKEKFSWRRIDPEKLKQLVADLRSAGAGATPIGVSTFSSDPESSAYADDIAFALQDAGYNVPRQYASMSPRYDMAISEESGTISDALLEAFLKADVILEKKKTNWPMPPGTGTFGRWNPAHPVIFVGLRPRPTL